MPTLTWTWTNAVDAPGKPIDYEVLDEIQNNVNAVNAALGPVMGVSAFAAGGTTITLGTAQADTNFLVVITPYGTADGRIGDVAVEILSVTQFKVTRSGSSTMAFRWKVIR